MSQHYVSSKGRKFPKEHKQSTDVQKSIKQYEADQLTMVIQNRKLHSEVAFGSLIQLQ